jgi:hypothetical protein
VPGALPRAELESASDDALARVLALLTGRRLLTLSATTVEVATKRYFASSHGWAAGSRRSRMSRKISPHALLSVTHQAMLRGRALLTVRHVVCGEPAP